MIQQPTAPHVTALRPLDLIVIGLLSVLVRLAFFNGPFGSDDVVYLRRAFDVANGDWSSSNYNGALRYAYNLPAGLMVYLFGHSTAAANLWPLACSVAEVLLVYCVAADIWGRRSGIFAAIVLATMPLHVSVASRIHVDPVVSLALSLGFALLYFGSMRQSRVLLFASGLAIGAVYWAKELAAVTLFAFLAFPLLWRRMPPGWPSVMSGGVVMLVAHLALMAVIAGDPLHMFKVVLGHSFIREGVGDGSAWYYFRYLLVDLRHTGLASLLAFAAVVWIARDKNVPWKRMDGRSFVVVWFLSVLCVLSFFPVSFSPLRFAMKQSNYLTLFLAPIAVLAGALLARISLGRAGLVCVALLGLFLSALQQADYRAFASNSKAAYAFARQHPGHGFIGSSNTSNVAAYYAQLEAQPDRAPRIYNFAEAATPAVAAALARTSAPVYAVWDEQTQQWAGGGGSVTAPLPCWSQVTGLTPHDLAWSNRGLIALSNALQATPVPAAVVAKLAHLGAPIPAKVYSVRPDDLWCGTAKSN